MTVEHRVNQLEQGQQWHQAQINLLTTLAEHAQKQLDELKVMQEKQHRMWVWLCRKNGWPEDEE